MIKTHPNNAYSLIVADIHLQPEADSLITHPINQAFMQFLQEQAPYCQSLYILGDLFEMWVGDDIGLEDYKPFIEQFKKLTDAGIIIYLQFGNRDFLMKQDFFEKTGIQLLDDIALIKLYEQPYLLLHGDSLCTDDTGYQRMRRWFRKPWIQWLFLKLSRKRRLAIGQKMRLSSKQHSQTKSQQIMDVNRQAVCDLFKKHPQVEHMIHGHTHRPNHHLIESDGNTLHRWVLGDWRPEAKMIKIDNQGPQLIKFE